MTPARISDEQTLRMVALRASGLTPSQIAPRFGVREQFVATATNRVFRADAAESGEDVSAFYWQIRKRGAAA